jgi:hypothetical protein
MISQEVRNFFCSLTIILLGTIISVIVFSVDSTGLGTAFNYTVILLVVSVLATFLGSLIILLLILKVIKNASSFVYIFSAVLNNLLGIAGLVLCFLNGTRGSIYILFAINLLLGLLLSFFFFIKRIPD